MFELEIIISFLLLGSVVGVTAGLLGVGGGGIMVPVLTTIFLYQGVPVEKVVHLALGTSMASIIFTSISSLRAHHARDGVIWPIVKQMVTGILIGTFLATFLASSLSSLYLAIFFSLFMAYVSLQMFMDKKPVKDMSGSGELFLVGTGIGTKYMYNNVEIPLFKTRRGAVKLDPKKFKNNDTRSSKNQK